MQYHDVCQHIKNSLDYLSQSSKSEICRSSIKDIYIETLHWKKKKAANILNQAQVIYQIQHRQVHTQNEQKSVCHILF